MEHFIKIIKFALIIIAAGVFVWVIWSCWFVATFHGDTYSKAEAYVIDINTKGDNSYVTFSEIVELLYSFQQSHPQYQLIYTDSLGNKCHNFSNKIENRTNQDMIFFYFEDIDMVFSCVTEVTSRNHPLVKLYAVNNGPVFRHWERINNNTEVSRKKNKTMKKKFETEVLDGLGVKWRHKRFWD